MRSSFVFLLAIPVSLAGLPACGGSTSIIQGESPDTGATGDAGQDAAPVPDGGGSQPDTGTGVDSGPDCDALLIELNALQAKAQACCATCDIVQCYSAVPGMCCDISVTEPTSPATQAFEAALTQYKQACPYGCPAIACQKAPSGVCGASGKCE
jgi:hypothetical protein